MLDRDSITAPPAHQFKKHLLSIYWAQDAVLVAREHISMKEASCLPQSHLSHLCIYSA